MKIRTLLAMTICTGLLASAGMARADIKYFPDPAYKRLNKDDPPPMEDMVELANDGDPRAMFILGDMSEKGKGGLIQDRKQARQWFEESAMHDYPQAFIRLAAMAKHDKNPKEAWQWYTLAINGFDSGDAQDYTIRARNNLVKAAGLTPEDIDQARKAIDDWKAARDKHLQAEKEAAAEKERQQEEQADKDAQAQKEQAQKEQAQKDAAQATASDSGDDDNSAVVKTAAKTTPQAKLDKQSDQQENDDEQN